MDTGTTIVFFTMLRFVLSISFFFPVFFLKGQSNLVPDPGFEMTKPIPYSPDYIDYYASDISPYWFNLANPDPGSSFKGTGGVLNPFYVNAPLYEYHNKIFSPRTGNGAATYNSLYAFSTQPHYLIYSWHSYLSSRLTKRLQKDKLYYVEYYVKPVLTGVYVSNIDLLFSTHYPSPYRLVDSIYYHPATPHIKNPSSRFISDTTQWTRICGFYRATGDEFYFTIGNFANDHHTDTITGNSPNRRLTMYILDDVTITEVTYPTTTVHACENNFPLPMESFKDYAPLFSYLDPNPVSSISFSQQGSYTYTIGNEACSTSLPITIEVDTMFNFVLPDTTVCSAELPLTITSPLPHYHNLWNDHTDEAAQRFTKSGTSWLTISNACMQQTDTFRIEVKHTPTIRLSDVPSFCDDDSIQLEPIVENYEMLRWYNGDTSRSTTVFEPGTYTLEAGNYCGITTSSIQVEGCPPGYFHLEIPNLVSPNRDGLNDEWQIFFQHIVVEQIQLYDRWGALITVVKPAPGWDGKTSLDHLSDGLYYYSIAYRERQTDVADTRKGWIQVLR
jgi:gliding motility-associated-like protein